MGKNCRGLDADFYYLSLQCSKNTTLSILQINSCLVLLLQVASGKIYRWHGPDTCNCRGWRDSWLVNANM